MRDPLVLIPGLACDGRVFGAQLPALSQQRTITVAVPNCGERMEEIASNLLDVLPPRFALAGHCLGGNVAMEILRRAPGRVTRLVLIATTPLAETPQSAADMEPAIIKLKAGAVEEAVPALIPPLSLMPGPGRLAIQSAIMEMARQLGPVALAGQLRALQRRIDYQTVLRKADVPTLIICGRHDNHVWNTTQVTNIEATMMRSTISANNSTTINCKYHM